MALTNDAAPYGTDVSEKASYDPEMQLPNIQSAVTHEYVHLITESFVKNIKTDFYHEVKHHFDKVQDKDVPDDFNLQEGEFEYYKKKMFKKNQYTIDDEGTIINSLPWKHLYHQDNYTQKEKDRKSVTRNETNIFQMLEDSDMPLEKSVEQSSSMKDEAFVIKNDIFDRLVRVFPHIHTMSSIARHYLKLLQEGNEVKHEEYHAYLRQRCNEEASRTSGVNAWDIRAFKLLGNTKSIEGSIFILALHRALLDMTFRMQNKKSQWWSGIAGLMFTSFASESLFLFHKLGPGRLLLTDQEYFYQVTVPHGKQSHKVSVNVKDATTTEKAALDDLLQGCNELLSHYAEPAMHLLCLAATNNPIAVSFTMESDAALLSNDKMCDALKNLYDDWQQSYNDKVYFTMHPHIQYKLPTTKDDPMWQGSELYSEIKNRKTAEERAKAKFQKENPNINNTSDSKPTAPQLLGIWAPKDKTKDKTEGKTEGAPEDKTEGKTEGSFASSAIFKTLIALRTHSPFHSSLNNNSLHSIHLGYRQDFVRDIDILDAIDHHTKGIFNDRHDSYDRYDNLQDQEKFGSGNRQWDIMDEGGSRKQQAAQSKRQSDLDDSRAEKAPSRKDGLSGREKGNLEKHSEIAHMNSDDIGAAVTSKNELNNRQDIRLMRSEVQFWAERYHEIDKAGSLYKQLLQQNKEKSEAATKCWNVFTKLYQRGENCGVEAFTYNITKTAEWAKFEPTGLKSEYDWQHSYQFHDDPKNVSLDTQAQKPFSLGNINHVKMFGTSAFQKVKLIILRHLLAYYNQTVRPFLEHLRAFGDKPQGAACNLMLESIINDIFLKINEDRQSKRNILYETFYVEKEIYAKMADEFVHLKDMTKDTVQKIDTALNNVADTKTTKGAEVNYDMLLTNKSLLENLKTRYQAIFQSCQRYWNVQSGRGQAGGGSKWTFREQWEKKRFESGDVKRDVMREQFEKDFMMELRKTEGDKESDDFYLHKLEEAIKLTKKDSNKGFRENYIQALNKNNRQTINSLKETIKNFWVKVKMDIKEKEDGSITEENQIINENRPVRVDSEIYFDIILVNQETNEIIDEELIPKFFISLHDDEKSQGLRNVDCNLTMEGFKDLFGQMKNGKFSAPLLLRINKIIFEEEKFKLSQELKPQLEREIKEQTLYAKCREVNLLYPLCFPMTLQNTTGGPNSSFAQHQKQFKESLEGDCKADNDDGTTLVQKHQNTWVQKYPLLCSADVQNTEYEGTNYSEQLQKKLDAIISGVGLSVVNRSREGGKGRQVQGAKPTFKRQQDLTYKTAEQFQKALHKSVDGIQLSKIPRILGAYYQWIQKNLEALHKQRMQKLDLATEDMIRHQIEFHEIAIKHAKQINTMQAKDHRFANELPPSGVPRIEPEWAKQSFNRQIELHKMRLEFLNDSLLSVKEFRQAERDTILADKQNLKLSEYDKIMDEFRHKAYFAKKMKEAYLLNHNIEMIRRMREKHEADFVKLDIEGINGQEEELKKLQKRGESEFAQDVKKSSNLLEIVLEAKELLNVDFKQCSQQNETDLNNMNTHFEKALQNLDYWTSNIMQVTANKVLQLLAMKSTQPGDKNWKEELAMRSEKMGHVKKKKQEIDNLLQRKRKPNLHYDEIFQHYQNIYFKIKEMWPEGDCPLVFDAQTFKILWELYMNVRLEVLTTFMDDGNGLSMDMQSLTYWRVERKDQVQNCDSIESILNPVSKDMQDFHDLKTYVQDSRAKSQFPASQSNLSSANKRYNELEDYIHKLQESERRGWEVINKIEEKYREYQLEDQDTRRWIKLYDWDPEYDQESKTDKASRDYAENSPYNTEKIHVFKVKKDSTSQEIKFRQVGKLPFVALARTKDDTRVLSLKIGKSFAEYQYAWNEFLNLGEETMRIIKSGVDEDFYAEQAKRAADKAAKKKRQQLQQSKKPKTRK